MKKFDCVHIYTEESISVDGFVSICDNWLTCTMNIDYSEARKLSKKLNKPVLYFYCNSDEVFDMYFFFDGKTVVKYCNDGLGENKGIFKLPSLVGYQEGNKRRISSILACKDLDKQIALLEEFLGVGLKNPRISVKRDDMLYQMYIKSEKHLTGKNAPIKKELVFETDGKLFHTPFFAGDLKGFYKPHIYLFGFDKDYDELEQERFYQWVEFANGKLLSVSEDEFSQVKFVKQTVERNDSFTYNSSRVYFKKNAPKKFASKSFKVAQDLYPFDYYNDDIFILTNENSTLFFVNSDFKIIAKQNFKGNPKEIRDGYILTVGAGSFWAYVYNPYDKVRIYRLYED